jgi:hypothetical protein
MIDKFFIGVLILIVIVLVSCECVKKKTCDPEAEGECPTDTVCKRVGPDEGVCLDVCEPGADDPCGSNEVCVRYADDTYACTPKCDPSSTNACPEDWACAPVAGDEYVCRPECDLDSDTCEEDEVCQPISDETAVCTPECDPLSESDCEEDWTCELRTDGLYSCYEPVYLKGKIFDSATESPIEGAHVIAVDKTGAAATDVAITDIDGIYELKVPVEREPDGTLYEGTYTFRISASDYLPYPHGIRPAIPIDATQASYTEEGRWLLQNASTEIALIALPAEKQGQGSISGSIVINSGDTSPGGVLVVVEGDTEEPLFSFSDKSGKYTVFNVPEGSWEVHGYKSFLQLDSVTVTLTTGEAKTSIDLISNDKSYGTVTGSLNIVNAPGDIATSVVLVPESTFNETFVKGEVPPGLRAPAPPESPSITDRFTIEGVPDGQYVVLAAFENDLLVRDPDPSIAGTQILHIQVPDGSSYEIDIASSFKVTEALVIVSPGATEPELVDGNPTFIWKDDSSETRYSIVVYNAFGDEVWKDDNLPRVTGSENVTVNYGGSSLQQGMYYQFRATSWKNDGPISQTEDLLGVFYTAAD